MSFLYISLNSGADASHAHTSQAFIPMGKGNRKDAQGGAYVVIGCLNGKDDKPDLSTLRAFLATSSQGVSYDEGIWRKSTSSFLRVRLMSDHSMKTVDGVSPIWIDWGDTDI